MVLLLVFTAVVQEISTLTTTRVRLETRDRAVAYASSLHEQMKAAGCGLDVDSATYVTSSTNTDSELLGAGGVQFKGPWGRTQGCAFTALERALADSRATGKDYGNKYWVDGNGTARITSSNSGQSVSGQAISLSLAATFCDQWGDDGIVTAKKMCNVGDQEFSHRITTNDSNVSINFSVKVNYWFEKTGVTTNLTKCSEIGSNIGNYVALAPDVIARRVTIEWNGGNGTQQKMVMTKRDSVPVDSVEFASGTRIGVYSSQEAAYMQPVPSDIGNQSYPFYVKRERLSENGCVWFPFLRVRNDISEVHPRFAQGSVTAPGSFAEPNLSGLVALSNVSM